MLFIQYQLHNRWENPIDDTPGDQNPNFYKKYLIDSKNLPVCTTR